MGLISLFLTFAISRYTVVGKVYDHARIILTWGTFMVMIHFIVQYILHKYAPSDEECLRTIVNLSFGIPLSYFFNMSNYYLLRKGKVEKIMWLTAPVCFGLSVIILVSGFISGYLDIAVKLMSVIYAFTLIYYAVAQVKQYRCVMCSIHSGEDVSLYPYIKWIRCSLFLMIGIPFGFPIMTFNTDLLMRSLYGILSISIGFFYVLSFMGYGLNGNSKSEKVTEGEVKRSAVKRTTVVADEKQELIKQKIEQFVKNESFIRNGITQKEAADEMGITVYRLKQWLGNSEFETFSRWIVYLRLKKSMTMLKEYPNLTSDEVADRCGFCDRQYFQRSFRKWMGVTPSQWVKKEGEDN